MLTTLKETRYTREKESTLEVLWRKISKFSSLFCLNHPNIKESGRVQIREKTETFRAVKIQLSLSTAERTINKKLLTIQPVFLFCYETKVLSSTLVFWIFICVLLGDGSAQGRHVLDPLLL